MWKSLIAVSILLCVPVATRAAEQKKSGVEAPRQQPLRLTNHRTYRLEVKSVNSRMSVRIEKHWDFGKAFPVGLTAAIMKHAAARKLDGLLPRGKSKRPKVDGGYIRWQPNKKRKHDAGGLLWFIDDPEHKRVGVSLDLILDRAGSKKPASIRFVFDQLRLTVDVENTRLTAVRWGSRTLPEKSRKTRRLVVHNYVEVDAMGVLTAKSSRTLEAADELFSGEVMQKLRLLGWTDLRNSSHHGITLGWLGYEHLRHNLFLLPGKPGKPIAFRYRVSGKSFPLKLVRRQLADDGWPMVLNGRQYVGSSKEGTQIVQPVEFVLSKRPATKKKTESKKTRSNGAP